MTYGEDSGLPASIEITGDLHTNDELPELIEALEPYDDADFRSAIKLLTPIAEAGNITAMFKLANSHSNLDNDLLAKKLYQLGVEAGDIRCMNNLAGILNREGDADSAFALYEKAAESGAAEPTYNFAVRLKNRGDALGAIKWAQKSLQAGYVRAPAMLSILFQSESERFHKLGLEMNSITSLGFELGGLLASKNVAEALELVERVNLENVHPSELNQLGSFCMGAGSLYFLLDQFEEAARYLELSLIPGHGLPEDQIDSAKEKLARCLQELSSSRDLRPSSFGPGSSFESKQSQETYLQEEPQEMPDMGEIAGILSYIWAEGRENPNLSEVIEAEDISLPLAFAHEHGYLELTEKGEAELRATYDFFARKAQELGLDDLTDLAWVEAPISQRRMTITIQDLDDKNA